jgi:hypothetical protein
MRGVRLDGGEQSGQGGLDLAGAQQGHALLKGERGAALGAVAVFVFLAAAAGAGGVALDGHGRKRFFLQKEAKTFACWAVPCGGCTNPMGKSFLVLFFKKELLA